MADDVHRVTGKTWCHSMKAQYRGFEIDVYREKCMGGWPLLYYSVFHISSGWELTSGFENSQETIRSKVKQLKARVNWYYEESNYTNPNCVKYHGEKGNSDELATT